MLVLRKVRDSPAATSGHREHTGSGSQAMDWNAGYHVKPYFFGGLTGCRSHCLSIRMRS
jgi:hypothetical protein